MPFSDNILSTRLARLCVLPVAAVATITAGSSFAAVGDKVLYGGSTLTITNSTSAVGSYSNPTYLQSKSMDPNRYLFERGTNEVVALTASDVSSLGYSTGDELVFFIESMDGTFYSGSASRNSDGYAHAIVAGVPYSCVVSFEDQYNLGDQSFGNAIFSVQSGGSAAVPGPMPALAALTAFGYSRKLRKRFKLASPVWYNSQLRSSGLSRPKCCIVASETLDKPE